MKFGPDQVPKGWLLFQVCFSVGVDETLAYLRNKLKIDFEDILMDSFTYSGREVIYFCVRENRKKRNG
jgi:hypothetical protein